MKKNIIYILILSLFASCANDDIATNDKTSSEPSGVVCSVDPLIEDGNETITRSMLSFSSTGMQFSWQVGDKITVFSDKDNDGNFTLASTSGLSAVFDGGGFQLIDGKQYYTVSKSTGACKDAEGKAWYNAPSGFNTDSYTNVKASYSGQRQSANGNTEHLGQYDYMAATADADGQNNAHFKFKHLGLTLRLIFKGLPAGIAFSKVTMYDASEDAFRKIARTTNITKGGTVDNYAPYWNDEDMMTERLSIDLGEEGKGLSVSSGENLIVYIEIPPIDLTGRTIAFRLTPQDGTKKPYFSTYNGFNLRAGKAVQMTMTVQECAKYNINVKVIKDWAKGNVQTVTRDTGDPGTTDSFEKPKYIYAFFTNNGRLVARAYASDIPETDWDDANGIFTYKGKWKNTTTGSDETESTSLTLDASNNTNPRAYIIASSAVLSFPGMTYGSETGTEESVIQNLTYTFTTQDDIKNLYSTPFVDSKDYVGTLGDDVKDVRLYHVASKLDVNWESATALSGNVNVNNIQTEGLSIFKPSTGNIGSGTTNISYTIKTGDAYNGRTIFYLPQPANATYNITLGADAAKNVTFSRDNVFSSWFRGLIK